MQKAASCGPFVVLLALAQSGRDGNVNTLLAAKDWSGLQRVLLKSDSSSLMYRAVFAIAFNQDSRLSETWLRAVIRAVPD